MRSRVPVALSSLLLALVFLDASPAQACSCIPGPFLRWPIADATGVSTEVRLIGVSVSDPAAIWLEDEQGKKVSLLAEAQVKGGGGCWFDPIYLVPQSALSPNHRYVFKPDNPNVNPSGRGFTTGAGPTAIEIPKVETWLFARDVAGRRILQVFVKATGAQPVTVNVNGERAPVAAVLLPSDPMPVGLSLGSVGCATIEIRNSHGILTETRKLCAPDKCLVGNAISRSSCDANDGWDIWENWVARSDGGCGSSVNPGGSNSDAGASSAGGAGGGLASNSDPQLSKGGCSMTGSARTGDWLSVFVLLVMAALIRGRVTRRARRRRSGRLPRWQSRRASVPGRCSRG